MAASTVRDVARPAPAAYQLLVAPGDGYGDVALERISLAAAPVPWRAAPAATDRLVVVLDGHATVTVDGGAEVTLAPTDVLHIGHGCGYAVAVPAAGVRGRVELLVLSAPEQPGPG